ncbi:MAG: cytochrome b N-terminal domain-containing protein [Rhizobiales bacterium]|nr:cytochrome b N-terminal domain-containing protein [Hyphomicrobiales bacterium]
MGGPSNYQPKSAFAKWFHERLPVMDLVKGQVLDFPTPKNLNYWWTFGGILSVMLTVQILTGIVLSMHYTASVNSAFASVEHIMRNVNYGWLLRYLHSNGGSMFFVAAYIHIFRGMYYGSYKAPREVLWMIGVLIYLVMMATAFMGYVLPWGQMSFWGAKVLAALVGLHIWALHVPGNNNPTGVSVKGSQDTVPFHPYYTMKDAFAIAVFLVVFMAFVSFAPNYLGHPLNYVEANPLVTPPHIVPEWYYLPFYAILRAIPDKLGGVVAMFGSILVLFALPWLDTSRVRSGTYRPIFKQFFWIFVIVCIGLGYLGSKPPEGAYVIWSRILTAYYFIHFLVILPLIGLLESPKPLPPSISDDVLAKAKSVAPAE